MSDLKPCPFCGERAKWWHIGRDENIGGYLCTNKCGSQIARGPIPKAEAAEHWNRRAPDPRADRIEALDEDLATAAMLVISKQARIEALERALRLARTVIAAVPGDEAVTAQVDEMDRLLSGTPAPDALVEDK